jgi:hypothetical protein
LPEAVENVAFIVEFRAIAAYKKPNDTTKEEKGKRQR